MAFWRDLLGKQRPCDLCQLESIEWPHDRTGVADWKVCGRGLRASFLMCAGCKAVLEESGLKEKLPVVGLAHLVAIGRAKRPTLNAYLQHPEWRKVWLHVFELAGASPKTDLEALNILGQIEPQFFGDSGPPPSHQSQSEPSTLTSLADHIASGRMPVSLTAAVLTEQLASVVLEASERLCQQLRSREMPLDVEHWDTPDAIAAVVAFNTFIMLILVEQVFPADAGRVVPLLHSTVSDSLLMVPMSEPPVEVEDAYAEHFRIIQADYKFGGENGFAIAVPTAAARAAHSSRIADWKPVFSVYTAHLQFMIEAIGPLNRAFSVIP